MDEKNILRFENTQMFLIDNMAEVFFRFNLDGFFTYVNGMGLELLKCSAEEMSRMRFPEILDVREQMKWEKIRQRLSNGLSYHSLELAFKNRHGWPVYVMGSLSPLENNDGGLEVTGVFQDITQMKIAERERDNFFLLSVDLLCVMNEEGHFRRVNPAFRRVLGYAENEMTGRHFSDFVPAENRKEIEQQIRRIREGSVCYDFLTRYRHRDGHFRWLSWSANPIRSENLIYAAARDVTETRELEDRLRDMAYTDDLTELLNRRGFMMLAEEIFELRKRQSMGILMMMADMDGMKDVNDRYGHPEGDELLRQASAVFRKVFRDADILARWGGDEFVACLIADYDSSVAIRSRLDAAIQKCNASHARPYQMSVSYGFSFLSPEKRGSIADLIRDADREMYQHKQGKTL